MGKTHLLLLTPAFLTVCPPPIVGKPPRPISPGPAPPAGSGGQSSPTSSTRASGPDPTPGNGRRAGLNQPGILWPSQPRGSTSVQGALGGTGITLRLEGGQRGGSAEPEGSIGGLAGRKWAQVTQASSPTSSACERPEDPGQLLPDPGRQEHDGRQPGPTPQFLNFQRAPL